MNHEKVNEAQKADAKKSTPEPKKRAELGPHATLGRIVHYHEHGRPWAAVVADVNEETVDLVIFRNGSTAPKSGIRQSGDGEKNTWSWPKKD